MQWYECVGQLGDVVGMVLVNELRLNMTNPPAARRPSRRIYSKVAAKLVRLQDDNIYLKFIG